MSLRSAILLVVCFCVSLCVVPTASLHAGPRKSDNVIIIDDKPLDQVITLISIASRSNIVVNWTALENEGIERDVGISLRLKNIKIEKLLQLVLDQASDGEVDLAYMIDDGIIHISTKADLNRLTKIEVYDIRDLLITVPNFRGRQIDLSSIGQNNQQGGIGGGRFLNGGGSGGSSGNLFSGGGNQDEEEEIVDDSSLLIGLIRDTIEPTSWLASGGSVGTANVIGSQLIVSHTASARTELRDL